MVKLEDAVIARLFTHGMNFEVLVDSELAMALKSGNPVDIHEVLATEEVFKYSAKGSKASEEMMQKAFGTTDKLKIAEQIIRKGEIQITTQQRRKMREDRLKQIVVLISRRAVNPQTGLPHPPARIEKALEEAGIHIDVFKSAEEQLSSVSKALRPILPLKFEIRKIAVKIPPAYAGKAYRIVSRFTIKKEKWLDDGSWAAIVEIPAGTQTEFFDKLNELTRGEVQTKVL